MNDDLQSGSLLAQVRPSVTTAVQAYASNDKIAEVHLIKVCNTSGAEADFSIYHDDAVGAQTFDESTALHFEALVASKQTVTLSADSHKTGIVVRRKGKLGVKSSVANALTFSFYGISEQSAVRKHER
jgi:hypothetical protein